MKIYTISNFSKFRNNFRAKLKKLFLVPADTFDNVTGSFPIGFFIWDTFESEENFNEIKADVYKIDGYYLQKTVHAGGNPISNWIFEKLDEKNKIGHLL